MANVEKKTVSLSAEQVRYIEGRVSSGDYGSTSEVVRAGLRALQQRDGEVEAWLQQDVATTFDAMHADRSRGLDPQSVSAVLREHHDARLKDLP